MSSPRPTFTTAEVNALIPRLTALIARLHAGARQLQVERDAAAADGGEPSMVDLLRARPGARPVVEEMEAIANEIAALGGQLKDLSLGLVDFPGVRDGVTSEIRVTPAVRILSITSRTSP